MVLFSLGTQRYLSVVLVSIAFSSLHLTEECRWLGTMNDFVQSYMSVKLLGCSQMLTASFGGYELCHSAVISSDLSVWVNCVCVFRLLHVAVMVWTI